MLTLNQHIEIFRNFQSNHAQLNSFGEGELSQLTEVNHAEAGSRLKYPIMFMEIGQVVITDNSISRSYSFHIADILQKASSNETEILSDTQQICFDLLAYLKNAPPVWTASLDKNTTLDNVVRGFSDFLAGWTMTINLKEAFQYNACDIPYNL